MERYERNMEAIRIAKSEAVPSREELDLLSKYVGWGDSQVYKEYVNRPHPVKNSLTPEEKEAIDASIINAHYTDVGVINTMWKLLERIGFGKSNDLRILDPSAGNGHFKSCAPSWAHTAKWLEAELDIVTGKILKKLHPDSDVRIQGFQTIDMLKDYAFDLAITNVPFGDVSIYHSKHQTYSLHNYFLVRMAEFLREGGVMAAITSRYSLDGSDSSHLLDMRKMGMKLLGAFRLPNTAFKKNARTEVVTDILFFIKDKENCLGWDGPRPEEWTESQWKNNGSRGYYLTRYFDTRPDQVIGSVAFTGTMYGRNEYTVNPLEGQNTVERLLEVGLRVLPNGIYQEQPQETDKESTSIEPRLKQVETSELFGAMPPSKEKQERIKKLTALYKQAKDLIAADYADAFIDNSEVRAALSKAYDEYVFLHGHINEQRSLELIKGTPAGMFLQSLEIVIQVKGHNTEYRKAAIFFKRTVNSFPAIGKGASVKDVYAFVLGSTGSVSIRKIAKLAEKSEDEIIAELKDEIFYDPALREWVSRDEYLSGNVRQKLEYAQQVCKLCKFDLTGNISELEKVMPAWKSSGDYVTTLQSRWIPDEILSAFFQHLFDLWRDVPITRLDILDERKVNWPGINHSYLFQRYGTYDMDATDIIDRILNTKQIVVYVKDENGNSIKDERATMAAQEKARIIKEEFDKWIYTDARRTEIMETVFNHRFNSHVNRHYDGSRMTFDGLNTAINLHPYQKDGAARIVFSHNTLISYDVGWGKTLTFLSGILKSISCGLAKKAMLVVPNHLVEQTVKQVMWAYPLANILFPTPNDMKKTTRPVFCSRIATSDFHIAVVPFSFFKLMPIADEIVREGILDRIRQISEILLANYSHSSSKFDTRAKKQLEKAKLRLEEKLKAMADMKKDSATTITFDRMGIDMLVTDEFHCLPYEALITTDQGLIPIGEIVEKKLHVKVKSVDLATNEIKWMPIKGWFNNPQSAPMVKIVHESGVFVCTSNHKIWTIEEGYVEAGKLSQGLTLKSLPNMQTRISAAKGQGSGETNSLLARMPEECRAQIRNEDLPSVREGIQISFNGQSEQREKEVLRKFLCGEMENGSAGTQRTHEDIHASHVGSITRHYQRKTISSINSSNADQQSKSNARVESKNVQDNVGKDISGERWQWNDNTPTREGFQGPGVAYGICNSDQTRKGSIHFSTSLLQGRRGRPDSEVGNRDRWGNARNKKMEILGQAQDRSLECSRVVSVTVLESESGFRSGVGAQGNRRVYCLEIASTHNFFAEGVLVSNCYKNLDIQTRMQSVAGLQTKGNQSTFDMSMKIAWLQKQGKKVVGSTATPVTNTIGEAYSLMRYFCPEELKAKGLQHFDAWADMFAVVESAPEMTPDGGGFRMNNRFRKFVNVEQLATMLGGFAEMRRGENEATFSRPSVFGGKMTKVVIPSTEELRAYVRELANRAAAIKSGGVRPDQDNMLLITSNGRMAALDMSLVVPKKNISLADMPKIRALVDNVYNIWEKSTPTKSTQLIFCDIGIWKPGKEEEKEEESEEQEENLTECEAKLTKDVYSIIRNALVLRGVPESEIAFAHEAKTPQQRRDREDAVNSGKVRVLIGSTAKMGTGMNVQTRLIAIHHLDAPWRPADIEQRNGRGWRQGNYHKKIMIFVYVIEGSFDGYVWQTLETKMSFIDQLMRGHLHAKEMDDISETVLSFAEIKAAASGNHKVIEFVVLTNEMKKLSALHTAFEKDRLVAQKMFTSKLGGIVDTEKHLARVREAMEARDQFPADPFEIVIERNSENIIITDKVEAGKSLRASIADHIGSVLTGRVHYAVLGYFRGFEIRLSTSIMNKSGTLYSLGYKDMDFYFNVSESDEGTIQSLINTSKSFEKMLKADEEKINSLRKEEAKMKEEAAKPWGQQARFDDVCAKYDALAKELSAAGENPKDELEKRREVERAMVDDSETVLTEIMEYVSTCHQMPSYISIFSALDGDELLMQVASHVDEHATDDLLEEKMKTIQAAVEVMEEDYAAIFTQIIVQSRRKKNSQAVTTSAVQYAFF
jgi:N12 class adenine-specific DNA methylase